MIRWKHKLQAVGVLILVLLTPLAYEVTANRSGLPGLVQLLVEPPDFLAKLQTAAAQNDEATPDKSVEFTQATAFRVAAHAGGDGGAPLEVAQKNERPTLRLPAPTEEPTLAEPPPQPQVEPGPNPDLETPQIREALVNGSHLLELEGHELPVLDARVSLADVDDLVTHRLGIVVGTCGSRSYTVRADGRPFLESREFVALGEKTLKTISNRALALNRLRVDSSWMDTSVRADFQALEGRLRAMGGEACSGQVPIFYFHPSNAFDRYLASKQLGVLPGLGVALSDLENGTVQVITRGSLVVRDARGLFVIRELVVNGIVRPWQDPEAVVAR